MGLENVAPSKLICVSALLIYALFPIVNSQIQGCSIQNIDIGLCLNQSDGSFSIDHKCCKELNKVVQIGYSCLCLLAATSFPLLSPRLFLPWSNCSISMPSVTLCRVIAPLPVVLPPSPNDIIQPPMLPKYVPMSPPPNEKEIHGSNITRDDNWTMVEAQPPSSGDIVPKLFLPNMQNGTCNGTSRSDMTKAMLLRSLFLFLALQGCIGLT